MCRKALLLRVPKRIEENLVVFDGNGNNARAYMGEGAVVGDGR
jgi:hypothetical protein